MVTTSSGALFQEPQPRVKPVEDAVAVNDMIRVEPQKIVSDGLSTKYYELPPDAKELNDLIEYKNMNFALANIFKACYRLGEKAEVDKMYDINKMIYFAERLKIMIQRGQY